MSRPIEVNNKVLIRFSIQTDKKGYTGKTDYIIGTVEQKAIDRHCYDHGKDPEYTTTYLVKFDEEYFLERSDEDKKRWIYPEDKKYITYLVFCEETNVLCDSYLKPKAIYRV
jgi:hypothetical protein